MCIDVENLQALRFGDDLVLFSTNSCDLQRMIEELNRRRKVIGLKMNIEKTKLITNGAETPIGIGENDIEYVNVFLYLG